MTLDEVVAANLRRIRTEQGLSADALAAKLGVGRHVVYDYEGPRPGKTQRAFLWRELVGLCVALDVTLLDLVLPEPGTARRTEADLDSFGWDERQLLLVGMLGVDVAGQWDGTDWRTSLTELLLGFPLQPENLEQLQEMGLRERARVEKLREEIMADFESVLRERLGR